MTVSIRLKTKILAMGERYPALNECLFIYFCYIKKDLIPPQLFNYVGGADFTEIGEKYFFYILKFCSVKKNERVLDIGSGIGRVAINFKDYLDENGRYEGFDIVKKGVRWCNEKIGKSRSNFSFQHADIINKEYNKKGATDARKFIFPYGNSVFDFAFASSVFTHMLPDALLHYLKEIHRCLRSGGRVLVSCFILNEESVNYMSNSEFNFMLINDQYGVMVEDNPEAAIAYEEKFINELFHEAGLNIIQPIHYGSWSGRKAEVDGQDIIVARKIK